MESQRVDKLKTIFEELRNSVDEKVATKLELDKCNRIIQRLSSFSSDCEECHQHFVYLESHIMQLKAKLEQLTESDFKEHKQKK